MPWYDAEAAVAATTTDRFWGATIQLFHVEVLVVLVSMRLIGDRREAPIAVGAFQARFGRTIVLAAQGRDGRPTFFGPAPIAQVLGQIPFDALAWKRYRLSRPKPLMLPIPVDPPPESRVSWSDLHVIPGVKPHRAEPPARGGGTRELVEGDQKPETVPLRRPRSEISYVRTFVRDPERDQTRG